MNTEKTPQQIAQSVTLEMVGRPYGEAVDLNSPAGRAASALVAHLDELAKTEYGIDRLLLRMRWNQEVLKAALFLNTQVPPLTATR